MVDWDKRYREGDYGRTSEPHALVEKFWHIIPKGVIIDVAAGTGRDSFFIARRGFPVYGIERSWEAMRRARDKTTGDGVPVTFVQADARSLPLKEGVATGVFVFYFLEREAIPHMIGLLKKGGIFIYETFLKRQNNIDRVRNPSYLLDDGELYRICKPLEMVFYEEGIMCAKGKRRAVAQFVGKKK